jgi:hypothetical protein
MNPKLSPMELIKQKKQQAEELKRQQEDQVKQEQLTELQSKKQQLVQELENIRKERLLNINEQRGFSKEMYGEGVDDETKEMFRADETLKNDVFGASQESMTQIRNQEQGLKEQIASLDVQISQLNPEQSVEQSSAEQVAEMQSNVESLATEATTTPEYQLNAIAEQGGSIEELESRTKEVDIEIQETVQEFNENTESIIEENTLTKGERSALEYKQEVSKLYEELGEKEREIKAIKSELNEKGGKLFSRISNFYQSVDNYNEHSKNVASKNPDRNIPLDGLNVQYEILKLSEQEIPEGGVKIGNFEYLDDHLKNKNKDFREGSSGDYLELIKNNGQDSDAFKKMEKIEPELLNEVFRRYESGKENNYTLGSPADALYKLADFSNSEETLAKIDTLDKLDAEYKQLHNILSQKNSEWLKSFTSEDYDTILHIGEIDKNVQETVQEFGEEVENMEEVQNPMDNENAFVQEATEESIEKEEKKEWKPGDPLEDYPEKPLEYNPNNPSNWTDSWVMTRMFDFRFEREGIPIEVKKYLLQNIPQKILQETILKKAINLNISDLFLESLEKSMPKMEKMLDHLRAFLPEDKIQEFLAKGVEKLPYMNIINHPSETTNNQMLKRLKLLGINDKNKLFEMIEKNKQIRLKELMEKRYL